MNLKHMHFKSYSDAGHGWIAVKRALLIQLGILNAITRHSYQSKSGKTVYLEEDADATTLINKLKELNITWETKTKYSPVSRIRSLPRFRLYE